MEKIEFHGVAHSTLKRGQIEKATVTLGGAREIGMENIVEIKPGEKINPENPHHAMLKFWHKLRQEAIRVGTNVRPLDQPRSPLNGLTSFLMEAHRNEAEKGLGIEFLKFVETHGKPPDRQKRLSKSSAKAWKAFRNPQGQE